MRQKREHERDERHRAVTVSSQPGSIAKAIAIGFVIDIGGSAVVVILATTIYGVILASAGRTNDEIQAILSKPQLWSPFSVITGALGLVMSVIAGYQCSVIANRNAYLAPGVLAVLTTACGAAVSQGKFS